MTVAAALSARRSTRGFDPSHSLPSGALEQLLTQAAQAPSAFNLQQWRLIDIQDRALRTQLRAVAWDQAQITDASALVLIAAKLDAWETDAAAAWSHATSDVAQTLTGMIDQFYRGRAWLQRDDAMRSVGFFAQSLMLAATEAGYVTCPMDGFDFDAVAQLVGLPPTLVPAMFVAIGKPLAGFEERPRPGRLPLSATLSVDRYAG